MTLQNLLRIGRLNQHVATAAEVQRLLAAIDRNIADASVASISDETRFDAAYKAAVVAECITQAKALRRQLQARLAAQHSHLLT